MDRIEHNVDVASRGRHVELGVDIAEIPLSIYVKFVRTRLREDGDESASRIGDRCGLESRRFDNNPGAPHRLRGFVGDAPRDAHLCHGGGETRQHEQA